MAVRKARPSSLLGRRRRSSARIVAIVASAAGLLVVGACGTTGDTTGAARAKPAVADRAAWTPQLPVPESGGVSGPDGYRTVGTTGPDGSQPYREGFVRNPDWEQSKQLVAVPVYNDHGDQIAYWAQGVGWIETDVADATGFDLAALRAQKAEAAAAHQASLESGDGSN